MRSGNGGVARRSSHRAAAVWGMLTAGLLLIPAPAVESVSSDWLGGLLSALPQVDKLVHGALFLVLAALLARSLAGSGVRRPGVVAIAAAVSYGVLLELVQGAVPGRSPQALDAVADAVGATIGAILVRSDHPRAAS